MTTLPCTFAQLHRVQPYKAKMPPINPYAAAGMVRSKSEKLLSVTVNKGTTNGILTTIAQAVSYATGTDIEDLQSTQRQEPKVFARHLLCFIATEHYNLRPTEIGDFLNNNRYAVYIAKKNVPNWIFTKDPRLARALPRLLKEMPQLKLIFADFKLPQP